MSQMRMRALACGCLCVFARVAMLALRFAAMLPVCNFIWCRVCTLLCSRQPEKESRAEIARDVLHDHTLPQMAQPWYPVVPMQLQLTVARQYTKHKRIV